MGKRLIGLCKLARDRCGLKNASTQGSNNVKTPFLYDFQHCFHSVGLILQPYLHEKTITSIPLAPKSSQSLVCLERVTILFLEDPAEVTLHLIFFRLATPLVGWGCEALTWTEPCVQPSSLRAQLIPPDTHKLYVFPERK